MIINPGKFTHGELYFWQHCFSLEETYKENWSQYNNNLNIASWSNDELKSFLMTSVLSGECDYLFTCMCVLLNILHACVCVL